MFVVCECFVLFMIRQSEKITSLTNLKFCSLCPTPTFIETFMYPQKFVGMVETDGFNESR